MTAFDVLNLADGAFPTGAHGHSGGLEYAIQAGKVGDRESFASWCRRALETAVFTLDLRAAVKAWYAGSREDAADRWAGLNADVAAFRTSRVQREASAQVGRSFLRSVVSCYGRLDLPAAEGPDDVQFPVAWGAAFRVLGLPVQAMAETLVFGAVRQWTQVAMRIVPLGQRDAFAAQTDVLTELPPLETEPDEALRPLASWAPGMELAALGMDNLERKYFRS
jgi:urease accessory protein